MTSSRADNPQRPPPASGFARAAWFLLLLHLVLSPLVFATATADVFEENKAALLTLTALLLAALALASSIGKRSTHPVRIGVLSVMPCPVALCTESGATTCTSPSFASS